jgi:hypothetical protein
MVSKSAYTDEKRHPVMGTRSSERLIESTSGSTPAASQDRQCAEFEKTITFRPKIACR